MTKAIELSQLGSNLHVGTDDQINLVSPLDTSNVRISADFDGSGTKNVYLRVAARENRRAALVFESVDSNNASTTRWALGRGDSDELPNTHFYIGTGLSGGGAGARLVIDNTGNVGIGTTNPGTPFHIRENAAALIRLQRTASANAGIEYKNDDSSMFAGLSSHASFWGVSPALDIGNNATFAITRADGNVGIGITEPVSELEVHSSTFSDLTISSARTTGNIGGFNFRKDTGGTPAMMAQMFVTTEGHYNFRAGGTNSSNHAFRISANGNVGVGTDNPTTTFMVYGADSATYRLAKSGILAYDHTFNGTSYTIANNNGSGGIPIIFGSRQAGAETLRMDSGGRLNVGNSHPATGVGRLHVKMHDGQDSFFKIRGASDFDSNVIGAAIDIRNSANSASQQLVVRADRYRLWTSDEKVTITSSGLIGINETNPGHYIDMNIGTTNIGIKMTSTDSGSYIQFADNSSTAETSIGAEGDNLKAYVNGSSRLFINSDGNVGLSTNNPLHKLHVHDGGAKADYIETSAHAVWTQSVQTGTGGSSGGVILKTNPDQTSSNLSGAYIYRVRAVVRNTGTDTGGTWLVYYKESSAAYQVRLVSRSGTSSNHPRLRIANANQMELYTTHNNDYPVRVVTERFYTQEPDSTLHAMGADYHWQRSDDDLFYEDGNVQIVPSAVDTDIFSIRRQDHATINLFRFFQDSNINQGTGAAHINTTNRDLMITASTSGGTSDGIYLKTSGNVGIGTHNPAAKLHIQGLSRQVASAFADNVTYGGRTFTANYDIQATSMRGGVLVRNMNDFRSETGAASFMHYDAYTTTAKSYAFRVASGSALSDTFSVKSNGDMYVKGQVTGSPAEAIANSIGWIPGYHQSNYDSVTWDFEERAIKLEDSDTTIGAILRAVPVPLGSKVKFTLNVRGSSAKTNGLYIRLYYYQGDLPNGKTHVSHNASASPSFVQEDDGGVSNWVENAAISSTYTTYERTWTNNNMLDSYVSLVVLNWNANGNDPIWIRDASAVPFN